MVKTHPPLLAAALLLVTATVFAQTAASGVVTGQIRGLDNKPAVGVRVTAIDIAPGVGLPPAMTSVTTTDSDGRYRLEGLPAGSYRIMAGTFDFPNYYRGATSPQDATIVPVARGVTVAGVDFEKIWLGWKVQGRVFVSSPDQPLPPTVLMQVPKQSPSQPPVQTAPVSREGWFEFSNVVPGEYSIVTNPSGGLNAAAGAARPFSADGASTTVKVSGDIAGLALTVPATLKLTCRVIFEGGERPAGSFQVSMRGQRDFTLVSAAFGSRPTVTGTILPGAYTVSVTSSMPDYVLKSLTYGQIDLMKSMLKLELTDTQELVITFAKKTP
jgi:hypothetical protein